MTPIIRVENLGKRYQLGASARRRPTLREALVQAASAPLDRLRRLAGRAPEGETFWALDDVSFEVQPGEAVGIIGRNGAGKSTLLKILSRITEPTCGRIELHGRVASLLEVGTGFHSELTGRENIYLNGAILGMSRAEIRRKFDEIVAFAEVERFLDTQVKHYSSGMYMRLAFAVAAHLDPEILVVDEVLAVGDAEFQKKCLEKLKQIGSESRTILFVSHNMSAIRQVCQHGMLLVGGRVCAEGPINAVVDNYLNQLTKASQLPTRHETPSFVIEHVEMLSRNGPVIKTFDAVDIRVRVRSKRSIEDPGLYVGILTLDGTRLSGIDFKDLGTAAPMSPSRPRTLGISISNFPLLPGHYQLELHLKDMMHGLIEPVGLSPSFEVVESPIYGGRKLDAWFGRVGLKASVIDEAY